MADSAHPGWYQAQGDPPGTERYWDGSAWTQGPRPIVETPSPPPSPPAAPSSPPTTSLSSEMPTTEPPTDMPTMPSFGASGDPVAQPPADMPTMPSFGASSDPVAQPSTDMPTMPPFGGAPSQPPTDMPTMPSFGSEQTGGIASGGVPNPTPSAGQPPIPGQATGFPGAPPAAAAGIPGAVSYPEDSKAVLALILSILGFFVLITAPFGLILGFGEKKAIDGGRRDPKNRGMAIAAMVVGGITTAFLLLVILLVIIAFAAAAA